MDTLFGRWLNKKAPEIKKEIEPDPGELTMDNAYKTRWIWYHTILALELLLVNMLLQYVIDRNFSGNFRKTVKIN